MAKLADAIRLLDELSVAELQTARTFVEQKLLQKVSGGRGYQPRRKQGKTKKAKVRSPEETNFRRLQKAMKMGKKPAEAGGAPKEAPGELLREFQEAKTTWFRMRVAAEAVAVSATSGEVALTEKDDDRLSDET